MKEPLHRKTMRHFNESGHAHLLTFSCYHRKPLLTNDTWKSWLSESINRTFEKQCWQLVSFVFMPEHIHILAIPKNSEYRVDELLFSIKRPFSCRVKLALKKSSSRLLDQLTVEERPTVFRFRFWQEGGGYDRNLLSVENCIKATEYLHNNPVRRRLCLSPELWRWSSWKFYYQPEQYAADAALPRVHGFLG